jgi:hypothetical protein
VICINKLERLEDEYHEVKRTEKSER